MTIRSLALLALAAGAASAALAAGGGGGGGGGGMTTLSAQKPADPQYTTAVKAIGDKHFADAIPLLEAYTSKEPGARDADAENWLGFAYRNTGNYDAAFLHYDRALAIDPKHRGAHEYMGEAYLLLNNLPQAEEHLAVLDKLCWLPCSEYSTLKTKVAEYRTAHAQNTAVGSSN